MNVKKWFLNIILFCVVIPALAQNELFQFGDGVEKVKSNLLQFGSFYLEDLKYLYKNGQVVEIRIVDKNEVALGLSHPTSKRTRYIFNESRLSKIIIEYFELSFDQLKVLKRNNSSRENLIGDFYFNQDYSVCTEIIMSNNLAALEIMHTDAKNFPIHVKKSIAEGRNRNFKFENERPLREKQKAEEERLKVDRIQRNVITIDTTYFEYGLFKENMKTYFTRFFQEEVAPKHNVQSNNFYFFDNTYSCSYALTLGRKSTETGNYSTKCNNNNSLLKGTDTSLYLFSRQWTCPVPLVEQSGESFLSAIELDSVHVFFTKGIVDVKIKKENVIYLNGTQGNKYLSEKLLDYFTDKPGKYKVTYEMADYLGEAYQKISHKLLN